MSKTQFCYLTILNYANFIVFFYARYRVLSLLQGLQSWSWSRSRTESEVFGCSRSRFPNNTGSRSGSRIFCPTPTPDIQLNHCLCHTPKLGIPVEMVQFRLKLLLKQISCCAPQFPLIGTAKFHSVYVKESGVGNFGK